MLAPKSVEKLNICLKAKSAEELDDQHKFKVVCFQANGLAFGELKKQFEMFEEQQAPCCFAKFVSKFIHSTDIKKKKTIKSTDTPL